MREPPPCFTDSLMLRTATDPFPAPTSPLSAKRRPSARFVKIWTRVRCACATLKLHGLIDSRTPSYNGGEVAVAAATATREMSHRRLTQWTAWGSISALGEDLFVVEARSLGPSSIA
jgi:hypothetical protein